jgi:hypothetical protein
MYNIYIMASLEKNKITKIGVLISSTSKNSGYTNFQDYILLKTILTFIARIKDDYVYNIYIGYDTGDVFFEKNHDQLILELNKLATRNIKFTLHNINNVSTSNPCFVWNHLFKLAYDDLNDYFFQTGDDITYETDNWMTTCIQLLQKNNNIGISGGTCSNTRILTQTLVSRKHYDIFKYYFPPCFKNWYSDDWINFVYKPNYFFWDTSIIMNNTIMNLNSGIATERYVCDNNLTNILISEVNSGKEKIANYLGYDTRNFVSGEEYHKYSKYSLCPRQQVINLHSNIQENDIIFVNLDNFDVLVNQINHFKPTNKFILITQNSDRTFTQDHFNLIDKHVNKIYPINCNYSHEKIHKIPIGFRDNRYSSHQPLKIIKNLNLNKTNLIYMNFTLNTNYQERIKCYNSFKDLPYVTKENNVPLENFYKSIASSKYVISPVGEGLDCHRVYESLHLNSIPIVKSTGLDDLYSRMPIIIVKEWSDVTEEFLINNYDKYKKNLDKWQEENKDWQYTDYWLHNIKVNK